MREVAKAAGTATTGRPVPKPAWKQLVEKRHVQREDDEQAAELKIAQENQDQGDVEGLGYAYKVEEQPLYAALENFELAVKDVRSTLTTELGSLLGTVDSASCKVTLDDLATLKKMRIDPNCYLPGRAVGVVRVRTMSGELADEEEATKHNTIRLDEMGQTLQDDINKLCRLRQSFYVIPFAPYRDEILSTIALKMRALIRVARVMADEVKNAVRKMEGPEMIVARAERERQAQRYEKEMEATRLAADAALQDMKRVLGVEKKKAVQEAKDDMEREMNARDKSRQAIEEEVEKKLRRKLGAHAEDLEGKLMEAKNRLMSGDNEVRRRCTGLEEELAKERLSHESTREALALEEKQSKRFRKLADELKEARAEQDTREEAISMELRRTTHEKQKSDSLASKEAQSNIELTRRRQALEADNRRLRELNVALKDAAIANSVGKHDTIELRAERQKTEELEATVEGMVVELRRALHEKGTAERRTKTFQSKVKELERRLASAGEEAVSLREQAEAGSRAALVGQRMLLGVEKEVGRRLEIAGREEAGQIVAAYLSARRDAVFREKKAHPGPKGGGAKISFGKGKDWGQEEEERWKVKLAVLDLEVEFAREAYSRESTGPDRLDPSEVEAATMRHSVLRPIHQVDVGAVDLTLASEGAQGQGSGGWATRQRPMSASVSRHKTSQARPPGELGEGSAVIDLSSGQDKEGGILAVWSLTRRPAASGAVSGAAPTIPGFGREPSAAAVGSSNKHKRPVSAQPQRGAHAWEARGGDSRRPWSTLPLRGGGEDTGVGRLEASAFGDAAPRPASMLAMHDAAAEGRRRRPWSATGVRANDGGTLAGLAEREAQPSTASVDAVTAAVECRAGAELMLDTAARGHNRPHSASCGARGF